MVLRLRGTTSASHGASARQRLHSRPRGHERVAAAALRNPSLRAMRSRDPAPDPATRPEEPDRVPPRPRGRPVPRLPIHAPLRVEPGGAGRRAARRLRRSPVPTVSPLSAPIPKAPGRHRGPGVAASAHGAAAGGPNGPVRFDRARRRRRDGMGDSERRSGGSRFHRGRGADPDGSPDLVARNSATGGRAIGCRPLGDPDLCVAGTRPDLAAAGRPFPRAGNRARLRSTHGYPAGG